MNNTITFKEFVKLIHPDTNPSITDAGAKMAEATKYKNSPQTLFNLGVKWGLIKGDKNQKTTSNHKTTNTSGKDSDFTGDSKGNIRININDVVHWRKFNRKSVKSGQAVVVDIDKVKKGKYKGFYRITLVDVSSGAIMNAKQPDLIDTPNINRVRVSYQDEKEMAKRVWNRHLTNKKRHQEESRLTKEEKGERNREDINEKMKSGDVYVVLKNRNGSFKVTRTTQKSVFYWDYVNNKERRASFSTVVMSFVK